VPLALSIRGEQEARLGAVGAGQPPQPPQHVGDVRAEDAAVGVGLVDHDPAEVGEEVAPALVVGQQADVQHVGVGQHEVVATADRRPLLARRVAVVDRLAQPGRAQRRQLARLVLRQRLGRVEVERPPLGIARDPVEHRQVEGEALARSGAAGDRQVGGRRHLQRVALVRVEALDPGAAERLDQPGVEPPRHRHRPRRALGLAALGDDAAVAACGVNRDGPSGEPGGRHAVSSVGCLRVTHYSCAPLVSLPASLPGDLRIAPETRTACKVDRS